MEIVSNWLILNEHATSNRAVFLLVCSFCTIRGTFWDYEYYVSMSVCHFFLSLLNKCTCGTTPPSAAAQGRYLTWRTLLGRSRSWWTRRSWKCWATRQGGTHFHCFLKPPVLQKHNQNYFYQNWSLKYFRGVKYSVVLRLIGPIFKSWSPLSF